MKWILRTARLVAFGLYLLGLFALPLLALWGWYGFLASLPLFALALLWLRFRGVSAIRSRLDAKPIAQKPSYLPGALLELSRRAGVAVPELLLMDSEACNVASFGFSKKTIVVTRGSLSLPKEELLALISRELEDMILYRVEFGTWLSQFLSLLDWLSGSITNRGQVPFRAFMKEIVLWPLTIVPLWCLNWRVDSSELDQNSVRLMGSSPRVLASAYRRLELDHSRNTLRVAVSERHLFRLPPRSDESVARAVLQMDNLSKRIRTLETAWRGA